MDLREWQGFAKVAARDGYKSYFTPGSSSVDKWNNVRHRGGVAFLVHKSVRHVKAHEIVHKDCQVSGLWLGHLQLINFYFPLDMLVLGLKPWVCFVLP